MLFVAQFVVSCICHICWLGGCWRTCVRRHLRMVGSDGLRWRVNRWGQGCVKRGFPMYLHPGGKYSKQEILILGFMFIRGKQRSYLSRRQDITRVPTRAFIRKDSERCDW